MPSYDYDVAVIGAGHLPSLRAYQLRTGRRLDSFMGNLFNGDSMQTGEQMDCESIVTEFEAQGSHHQFPYVTIGIHSG